MFVVGGRQFTSQVMQKNCHEFIAYENLVSRRPAAPGPRRESSAPGSPADVAKAIPLVKRALKVLTDREVSPQLGLLKSTLLQLDSTFSERDYGVSTFRDFIEKVAKTGLVTLRHSGRSMMVDAVESQEGTEAPEVSLQPALPVPAPPTAAPLTPAYTPIAAAQATPAVDPEQIPQIVESTRDVFNRAAPPPRWPMYVRQLKQFIRGVDPTFDERKWGFATIMEFLRVCQREGLLRLERDRRGQIRVFPGAALQGAATSTTAAAQVVDEQRPEEIYEAEPVESPERDDASDSGGDSGSVRLQPEFETAEPVAAEPNGNVIEMDEPPAPPRGRRARKTPAAGKPPARKSTGARTSTRRRKKPVSA